MKSGTVNLNHAKGPIRVFLCYQFTWLPFHKPEHTDRGFDAIRLAWSNDIVK